MNKSMSRYLNRQSRRPNRRKPRSPGVMLRGRAPGLGYWDDEVRRYGGQAALHRQVRAREKARLRRALTTGRLA